ncbi:MAG: FAD-binding protein [Planctomycetes bacterium]|nr:FAD-binding protein [Planctomycetota bacterium]
MPVYSVNTLVIGSGAAALNAVLQLLMQGQRDVLLVTERWGAGASNEAGSDKQTYYKLSLAGDQSDSPRQMAEDLFAGGCMHGDIALCEAQHSAQAFYHLVSRGVPFPHDRHGGYVGYQTDHDQRGRATSAGPLTSHMMCTHLGAAVRHEGVPVLDEHQVIALLTHADGTGVCGALALDKRKLEGAGHGLVFVNAVNVILATGGPGGMYRTSVYPESQIGSTGLALAIGAVAQNLTESQFGLASIKFRWNVSGSYQQVIPRYISTDANGGDEREFLAESFPDMPTLTTAIFRKGYQWPFDSARIRGHGSSLIDVLVYRETVMRGRRVFLDFTQNPAGPPAFGAFTLADLDEEARSYLEKCRALLPTPIERLRAMNEPAYQLYRAHEIDLACDPLEIAVCAQHNNGGLRGNAWWESNIPHLFPVGEVNGSHGVRRPGGAALNAGQVGGIRAALYITRRYVESPPSPQEFIEDVTPQIAEYQAAAQSMLTRAPQDALLPEQVICELQERMSSEAAIIRTRPRVEAAAAAAWRLHARARENMAVRGPEDLPQAFRARDLVLTHAVYLEALAEYLRRGGRSRGSFLVLDERGAPPTPEFDDAWRYSLTAADDPANRQILEVRLAAGTRVQAGWVDVHPIPRDDNWFEAVWREYTNDRIIK